MSAFKKSLLVAGVAMILSNNVFADEGHGIVKFKGEVISAPCSIKPGDEDLTVNLGEVADTGSDSNLLIVFYVQIMPDD
ncbi:hypothetical protein FSH48_008750, partial [Escherichia coli]|nr:hypothetical protein [Escherichia coli]